MVARTGPGGILLEGADFGVDICVGCDLTKDQVRERNRKETGSPHADFMTGHKLGPNWYKLRFMMCGTCFRKWKKWADENIDGACPHRWILTERKQRANNA